MARDNTNARSEARGPASVAAACVLPPSVPLLIPGPALAQADPFEVISEFLASPILKIALVAVAAFVVAVWLALAYRTYVDAVERGSEPLVWGLVALILPFAGALLYAIVKPRDYAENRDARFMQLALLTEEYEASRTARREDPALRSVNDPLCAACGHELGEEHLFCPGCGRRRRTPCGSCGAPLERSWAFCPGCGRRATGARDPEDPEPSRSPRRVQPQEQTADPERARGRGSLDSR